MAVLAEAISVIVRRDAITARFSGGWRQFLAIFPIARCVPMKTSPEWDLCPRLILRHWSDALKMAV